MNVRQSIVVRKDLQMTPGLLAAQVAHLSAVWWMEGSPPNFRAEQKQWISGPVLSVLAVNTPEELEILRTKAAEVGVETWEWRDTIPSQIFDGQFLEVLVGLAFGPDDDEKIKQVTGTLPLY